MLKLKKEMDDLLKTLEKKPKLQIEKLKRGYNIIVGIYERIIDMIDRRHIKIGKINTII